MDQSGQYNDQEIQILCELRLKNIPGIVVNTTLLNDEIKKLAKPINMESILSFVQHLYRTDLSNEQRIFRFDEAKMIVGGTATKPIEAIPITQTPSSLQKQ
jgi:predicted metal-dependent phosphoesterase TrpH